MSTFVLMKILESAPSRYDRGIYILTYGQLGSVYDRLAFYIKKGHQVLDIGCGTGALTLKVAQKGAYLKGIDVNPQMLEIAQRRANEINLMCHIELIEMGVAELGSEKSESYDAVTCGLCLSELSEDELSFTLKEIKRILKPKGLLLIADEVIPKNIFKKLIHWLLRIPLTIVTYVLTQTTTKAITNLPEKIKKLGFMIRSVRLNRLEDFIELVAMKPLF